jgi:hypothetical protein
MGAGASIPEDKMTKFKEKLLVVETLNEQQKMRLLEQMAYELQKANGPPPKEVRFSHSLQTSAPPRFTFRH